MKILKTSFLGIYKAKNRYHAGGKHSLSDITEYEFKYESNISNRKIIATVSNTKPDQYPNCPHDPLF